MTTPDQLPPATSVEEVKEQAERLGLTWQIREATVTKVVDSTAVLATFDGDTDPKPMVLIGPRVIAGDRVYVISVPPQGNYVLGALLYLPGQKLLTMGVGGGTQIASTTSAAEIAFTDYIIDVPLIEGHLTRLHASYQVFTTVLVADQLLTVRIREDSLSGTAVAVENVIPRGNVFSDWKTDAWFVASSTRTQRYIMSAQRNIGVATWGANASTTNVFAAFDCGRPVPGTVFAFP